MFWNIYNDLCVSKGLSPNAVAGRLHIASGSVTKWKNGATPSAKNLKKIADFFCVTTGHLLGTQLDLDLQLFAEKPMALSPEETALIEAYRAKPELAPAVRKLLDVPEDDGDLITAPMAAHSSDYTPAGTEAYTDKRAGEFTNAPDVPDDF